MISGPAYLATTSKRITNPTHWSDLSIISFCRIVDKNVIFNTGIYSLFLFHVHIPVFPPCIILTTCYISSPHRNSKIISTVIHLLSCSIKHAIQSPVTHFLFLPRGGVVELCHLNLCGKTRALHVVYRLVNSPHSLLNL